MKNLKANKKVFSNFSIIFLTNRKVVSRKNIKSLNLKTYNFKYTKNDYVY